MTCTDVSQESLNICKQKIPDASCIKVEPTEKKLPAGSEVFDLLLCIEVAPVIQEDWFIDEAYRVMNKNSTAILMCWNRLSLRGFFVLLKDSFRIKGKHDEGYYKRSYPEWKSKFETKGFKIIKETGFCWFPFSRESNSRFIPYFVALERMLGLRKIIRFSPWVILVAKKR